MKNKESRVVLYLVNELFAVLFMSELFITCPVSANYPKGSSNAIWSRSSVTKGIEPSDKKHPCRHCQVGKGEGGVAGDFNCVVYK